jgi:hypothetical protein
MMMHLRKLKYLMVPKKVDANLEQKKANTKSQNDLGLVTPAAAEISRKS